MLLIKGKKELDIMKYSANVVFFIISGMLSINMFIQFTSVEWLKWVFLCLSIGFEIARYYNFIMGKAYLKADPEIGLLFNKWEINLNIKKAIKHYLIYAGLAVIVVAASYGFSVMSLENQSEQTDSYSGQKDTIMVNIKIIGRQIENKVNKQENITNMNWEYWLLDKQIKSLRNQLSTNQNDLKNYKETKINVQKTMFESFGKLFGRSSKEMEFILLLLMSILLEVCLMTTSLEIDLSEKKEEQAKHNSDTLDWIKKNKIILFKYVDGLLDIKMGLKRLNGNAYITKKFKVAESDCCICKGILQKIKKDGVPLINTIQGSSEANFTKMEIKLAIETILKK